MEDLTSRQLGPYRVESRLGAGGMAVVYKAYQPSMERYIALKILPRHLSGDPDFVDRFKREVKIIAHLEHPHILPVHDYGQAEGYTYLAMRYVEGGTLADRLQGKPLPLAQICDIVTPVAAALDYAHARGVIHRDIKPSNVLIDQAGNCLLGDFGIAKIAEATGQLSLTSGFIGTPAYASPEQCLGRPLDGRSDIYSLGVMAYEMATGRLPFQGDTGMAILVKQIHDPLPAPRTLNPDLPPQVERVIVKALAKEPEQRYQTAGELAQALAAAASARPETRAQPTTPLPKAKAGARGPRPERRARPAWLWPAGGLLALVVLAVLVIGGLKLLTSQPTATATQAPVAGPVTPTITPAPTRVPAQPLPTAMPSPSPAVVPSPLPTALPAGPQAEPLPIQGFGLPLNEPYDLVYDGQDLYGLFDGRLVKLELVVAEGRFRAAGQVEIAPANSLAWDPSRDSFWAVRGGPSMVGTEIDLLDRAGQQTATFTVPETFAGSPRYAAWDGQVLWLSSNEGALFKMEPAGSGGELRQVDSYAPAVKVTGVTEASGLTWDGNNLWVLVGDELSKLDRAAQPLCQLSLVGDVDAVTWYGWRGLAWDGQFLWVGHADASRVYRVDPATCR